MSMHLRGSRDMMGQQEEEGWWKSRTGLEQKLLILSTLLFILSFGLTISVIVLKNKECPGCPAISTTPSPTTTDPTAVTSETSPIPTDPSAITPEPTTVPTTITPEPKTVPTTIAPEPSPSPASATVPSSPTQ